MARSLLISTLVALVTAAWSIPAMAGDAAKGKKVFKSKTCAICHTVVKGKKKMTGPNLFGVIGRKAGTHESYRRFTKALKKSGLVWDEKNLDTFLKNPKKMVKGTMMQVRLTKKADRDNVIAYLKTLK